MHTVDLDKLGSYKNRYIIHFCLPCIMLVLFLKDTCNVLVQLKAT